LEPVFGIEEPDFRYVIGVDLGTTNSAVAYVDLSQVPERGGSRKIRFFPIPQLVAPGEIAEREVLPSFLYLPGEYDLPPGSTALPWDPDRKAVVGEFAREQGARVPGRLVSSAKSWLSHAGVDRTAPILPWGAKDDFEKVSPLDASARYLRHIRESWNQVVARDRDGYRFEEQLVLLTVPASFDEVARELTVTAAHRAGIPRVVLLEEPLAAFYAWLSRHEATWQQHMQDRQLILVCDVGGGTSDFSILGVFSGEKGLRFNRLAVGEHLMLGGDNMDFTLGRHAEAKMTGAPGRLDALRWSRLVYEARRAKETLLDDRDDRPGYDLTVTGTGGKLIAGTLKASVTREEVRELILDGFFPIVGLDEPTEERTRAGLTELGLPYVRDPAVTRHLAAFWRRFESLLRDETGREKPYPDFVLYNGGALAPRLLRSRLTDIIGAWFEGDAGAGWKPVELPNPSPELSVAIGAAYYGLVRIGEGVRVGSGSPRTYYVGVEAATAADGAAIPAVCLVPRGTEEGFEARLEEPGFIALTNQPVTFQVYSSSTRLGDAMGQIVTLDPEETSTLPPIRTVLRYGKKGVAQKLPVQLSVRLTEVGTLELWCHSVQTEHRWQLQFDVRQEIESTRSVLIVSETIDAALIEQAEEVIRRTFEGDEPPEKLRRSLEEALDMPRSRWPLPVIRKLADSLLAVADGRKRTGQHEERWLNVAGYCLRPGFGDAADELRIKLAWRLYIEGIQFHRQVRCRSEWWTFWRRIAGGLSAGQQMQIYQEVRPTLASDRRKKSARLFPEKLGSKEEIELWMALANLERLPSEARRDLGNLLLERISGRTLQPQELWAISRFGARTSMYGPLDRLIPANEAAAWIKKLLALKLPDDDATAHALVHLASRTGDRTRDVPEDIRTRVAKRLAAIPGAERYLQQLEDPDSTNRSDEQDWIFGESLPAGLVLGTGGE